MKRFAIALVFSMLILSSCGNKKSSENTDSTQTHQHDDGTTHKDHNKVMEEVPVDSAARDSAAHGHSHDR